ncbi:MAG: hypothetical protein HOM21_03565, partial [Halobacteriovoraceae bacterium]|nr:hypothetical protein [Halobacteriovoraceae bacterium]
MRLIPIIIFLFFSSTPLFGQNVAKIYYLKGDVKKFSNNQHQKLMAGVYLNEGEVLNTGAKSLVILTYGSGSKLKLGENSSLTIKPIVAKQVNAGITQKVKHFFLEKGDVIFNIKNKSDGEQLRLHTKSVAVGVRGTVFFVHETEAGQVTTIVLEGKTAIQRHKNEHIFEVPEGHGTLHSDKIHSAKFKAETHAGLVNWNFDGDLHHDSRLFEELGKKHKSNHKLDEFIENVRNVNMQEVYTHITNGVSVDGHNKNLETGLGLATYYFEKNLVEILVKNGADPAHPSRLYNNTKKDFINIHFETPMHILVRNLPAANVKLRTLKMQALEQIAQLFILTNKEVLNARNKSGETPIMLALRGGTNKIAQLLLNNGANVLAQDNAGQNLMFKLDPTRFKEFQYFQIFFTLNQKLFKQVDNEGRTSSHFALQKGWWKVFSNFAQWTDPYLISKKGDTLLMLVLGASAQADASDWSVREGYANRYIRDLKMINLQNQFGETALIRAAKMKLTRAGIWLIKNGAVLSARDNQGKSALSIAIKNKNIELSNLL